MAYKIVSFIFILNVIRTSASNISGIMAAAKLIPSYFPNPPAELLSITYSSGAVVDLGNELTPRQVKDEPTVKWLSKKDTFYTLLMFDADGGKHINPLFRQLQHWLVINIPGDEVAKGEILSEYIGAFPQNGTGLHRYVFLLYEQLRKRQFAEAFVSKRSLAGRDKFAVTKFAKKYQLGTKKYLLGTPLAGNFFTAQWDDYVPELYESLDKESSLPDL